MKRLPIRGASLLTPARTEDELKFALGELGVADSFDEAGIHDLYFRIGQICGSWFSEQEAAEVSPVSKALRSTGKSLLEASQLLSGHQTGLRTHVEIEVTSQVAKILAPDPSAGAFEGAKALISRFQEEAAQIGHACLDAYADLNRKSANEGRARLLWYDQFTALLLDIAAKAGVEPTLGRDRITRAQTGWLFEAAQTLEPFLHKYMRSPSAEACGKRLERSRRRLTGAKRQNPRRR
jgi:hypothetical protein